MVDRTLCVNENCKAKDDCHNYVGFWTFRGYELGSHQSYYNGGTPKEDGSCEDLSLWKSQG